MSPMLVLFSSKLLALLPESATVRAPVALLPVLITVTVLATIAA